MDRFFAFENLDPESIEVDSKLKKVYPRSQKESLARLVSQYGGGFDAWRQRRFIFEYKGYFEKGVWHPAEGAEEAAPATPAPPAPERTIIRADKKVA